MSIISWLQAHLAAAFAGKDGGGSGEGGRVATTSLAIIFQAGQNIEMNGSFKAVSRKQ